MCGTCRLSLPQLEQVEYGALVIDTVVSGEPIPAFFDGIGRAPQGSDLCNRSLYVIHPVGQHHQVVRTVNNRLARR